MNIHEIYINRCIELAKNGQGTTYPNPMVGSVVVYKGEIIGEGWHKKSGGPHAEVNAIDAVRNKSLLSESEIYVNLEPCSHMGKTPPCAHYIVKHGIKKVIIGMTDVNKNVCGRGIQYLKDHGCEVVMDVLKESCKQLNKRFITFHEKKRPFIILKWAKTADGFIDKLRGQNDTIGPNWITNKYARQFVHKMRSEEQAILVGTNTVLNDNPTLTVRDWSGVQPLRVVVDKDLAIPATYNIYNKDAKTLVFTSRKTKSLIENVEYISVDFQKELIPQIVHQLYLRNIQSIIVEGGAFTLQEFIEQNYWDEIFEFEGAKLFEKGLRAPVFTGNTIYKIKFNDTTLSVYENNSLT